MTAEQEAPAHVREGVLVASGDDLFESNWRLYVHDGRVWLVSDRHPDGWELDMEGGLDENGEPIWFGWVPVLQSLALGLAEMHAWAHRGISACALEEENHAHDDEYQNWRTEHLTLALVLREMRSLFQREG